MLLLERKEQQAILIGNIRVVVCKVAHGYPGRCHKVQIGIDAPPNVPVDREEVRQRKERGEP